MSVDKYADEVRQASIAEVATYLKSVDLALKRLPQNNDHYFRVAEWVLLSIDDVNNRIRYPNTIQRDGSNNNA